MNYKYIDKINSPADLKKIAERDVGAVCDEIRRFLIENVERSGGHLASNLGVTELTVALHRVFDSPKDKIIFDVGHQSYVHKIITGRRERFTELRKTGGLSGFTLTRESEHDPFGAGHSSTSVSAALGFAEAERLCGGDAYSIAVIGDGAYTGGMVHEALNNCDPKLRLIIVLNENGMSISLNKGRFASYLTRVRTSKKYRGLKRGTKSLLSGVPLLGKPVAHVLNYVKNKLKSTFLSPNYFEALGLYYIGPIDGNDYGKVERVMREAKELGGCVVVHLKTMKGKGYEPAERSPVGFHSISASVSEKNSFHEAFAEKLTKMANEDNSIVAVTAAMGIGTGLNKFGEVHCDRYFDVGIAEEHAVTFSAGLAAAGLKPFVAIYSTFLQRAYDSIIHDVCLQNLPVKLIVDRASLAVSDGATHHGIFDVSFLSAIPCITLLAPITYGSLAYALETCVASNAPVALRYPNLSEDQRVCDIFYPDGDYSNFGVRTSFAVDDVPDYLFITYGSIVSRVIDAYNILISQGRRAGIILLEALKPYGPVAEKIKNFVLRAKKILFVEEGILYGGAGMLLQSELSKLGTLSASKYEICAIDGEFANPNSRCDIYDYLGMSPDRLAEKILTSPLEKNHE